MFMLPLYRKHSKWQIAESGHVDKKISPLTFATSGLKLFFFFLQFVVFFFFFQMREYPVINVEVKKYVDVWKENYF